MVHYWLPVVLLLPAFSLWHCQSFFPAVLFFSLCRLNFSLRAARISHRPRAVSQLSLGLQSLVQGTDCTFLHTHLRAWDYLWIFAKVPILLSQMPLPEHGKRCWGRQILARNTHESGISCQALCPTVVACFCHLFLKLISCLLVFSPDVIVSIWASVNLYFCKDFFRLYYLESN